MYGVKASGQSERPNGPSQLGLLCGLSLLLVDLTEVTPKYENVKKVVERKKNWVALRS